MLSTEALVATEAARALSIAALSAYGQKSQEAVCAFNHACSTGTSEEIQAAFEAYVKAKGCAAEAQQVVVGLTRDSYRDAGAQWVAGHPQAKDVLLKVCELRLQQAKEKAATALANESQRLGPEYDANDSPIVKRQADKVKALEVILNRVNTQAIEDTFTNAASTLLEWDE